MKVYGVEIREDVIDHCLAGMNKDGFLYRQLAGAIAAQTGAPREVASRAADRALQKLRKSGAIYFNGRVWAVTR